MKKDFTSEQINQGNKKKNRRNFGEHFTSIKIFKEYIFPAIRSYLYDYTFIDLYCGEGNLILPILDEIPDHERNDYFKAHIFLRDIQPECIEKARIKAQKYGISADLANINIKTWDSLSQFPPELKKLSFPIFHITNPPYLYLGYIRKHTDTQKYLPLFEGANQGYQDLYQIALINDFRTQISKLIYIIPTNFLFGNSVSNKFRDDFLPYYEIEQSIIFETQIFEHTGTNVIISFFKKRTEPFYGPLTFKGVKWGSKKQKLQKKIQQAQKKQKIEPQKQQNQQQARNLHHNKQIRQYKLVPSNHYKAGNEFDEFVQKFHAKNPLKVTYYLKLSDVKANPGSQKIKVIDSNDFRGNSYTQFNIEVNEEFSNSIKQNPLWIRTLDTGTMGGRAGIYFIPKSFNTAGILVTKATYRTNPIQIFLEPVLTKDNLEIVVKYFNLILEYLRNLTDSEFLTTYKYSGAEYTRKYLGLSQTRKIFATFPILDYTPSIFSEFTEIVKNGEIQDVLNFLKIHLN